MLALAIHLCLTQKIFPRWLPYFSTGADVVLLTSVICIGAASRSPLIVGYFLIIALAALRFSLPLLWASTVACVVAYICVLGCPNFTLPGTTGVTENVPRYHQVMVALAIVLTGVVLAQLIKSGRSIAEQYVSRANSSKQN